jgi:hypothetical protein
MIVIMQDVIIQYELSNDPWTTNLNSTVSILDNLNSTVSILDMSHYGQCLKIEAPQKSPVCF